MFGILTSSSSSLDEAKPITLYIIVFSREHYLNSSSSHIKFTYPPQKEKRAINAVFKRCSNHPRFRQFRGVRGHSQFHWRRQSQEGRISTVEAAALVMEELIGQESRGTGDALRKSLAVLMDALGRQCHHES